MKHSYPLIKVPTWLAQYLANTSNQRAKGEAWGKLLVSMLLEQKVVLVGRYPFTEGKMLGIEPAFFHHYKEIQRYLYEDGIVVSLQELIVGSLILASVRPKTYASGKQAADTEGNSLWRSRWESEVLKTQVVTCSKRMKAVVNQYSKEVKQKEVSCFALSDLPFRVEDVQRGGLKLTKLMPEVVCYSTDDHWTLRAQELRATMLAK